MKKIIFFYILIVLIIALIAHSYRMLRKDKAIEIMNEKIAKHFSEEKIGYKLRYLGTRWYSNDASWCSYYVFTKKDYMHELVICVDPLFKSTESFSSVSEGPRVNPDFYLGQELEEENQIEINQ